MMCWCRFVTRPIIMGRLLLLFLLLSLASAESLDTDVPKLERSKRQSSTPCDEKYSKFRSTHTRCLANNPDAQMVTLSQATKDEIVNYHNKLRANVTPTASNMLKLVWCSKLEKTAMKWSMQCSKDHDDIKDRMEPDWRLVKIGQNLGLGHSNFRSMMDRFYTEKDRKNYVYGQGYIEGAGHFYQMVTAATILIGCAESFCPSSKFLRFRVCNYAKALDSSKPPYISGPPCSACPDHCDSSGKLCDCGNKLCYSNGRLNVATCMCECQSGRTGENCEMVDCSQPDSFSSCRSGSVPKSACGVRGLVRDPSLCPHYCGICDLPCAGKVCESGFTLDTNSCSCDCRGGHVVDDKCEGHDGKNKAADRHSRALLCSLVGVVGSLTLLPSY